MGKLTDDLTVNAYKMAYSQGYDHSYPNENIVRLEASYLRDSKGVCLDYGYGFGENLIHLAKNGYSMHGIDIDETLIDKVNHKISSRNITLDFTPELTTMDGSTFRLPYKDNSFDCLLSNQTVYLLADEGKIQLLLEEFYRILKPGAKMLITMMGEQNYNCFEGEYLGNNVYEYDDKSVMNNVKGDFTHRYYILHSEPHINWLFKNFNIDEVGSWDNIYRGVSGHHYVIMCHKPK